MRTLIYLMGMFLAIGALAYGAFLLGAPRIWIWIGAIALAGLAIAGAARTSSRHDTYREVHHY